MNSQQNKKSVAHFLLISDLATSPPNDAFVRAYNELGYDVEMFAPPGGEHDGELGIARYGYRWLLRNIFSFRWAKYAAFSCTSEDPIAVAGLLAFIWRKPLVFLSDEIKSGTYRGNRSERWKRLCRWCMRRASFTIVNDESRMALQRNYAGLTSDQQVVVFPGCFVSPPEPDDRLQIRQQWGVPDDDLVLCFSGGCSLFLGIDWVLDCLDHHSRLSLVVQLLNVSEMNRYLLANHKHAERIHTEQQRLSWQQAWASMGGVDIGIAVYSNPADQFQLMGISSNRLCMFLAMGVPVIVSKQASFQFVEDYDCGVMVENAEEFSQALGVIEKNLTSMRQNALKCAREYINTEGKYRDLLDSLKATLRV